MRLKTTSDFENFAVRVCDHVDVANITFENSDHILSWSPVVKIKVRNQLPSIPVSLYLIVIVSQYPRVKTYVGLSRQGHCMGLDF